MLKKILIGSCFAFTLFLATIFLFGDRRIISLDSPRFANTQTTDSEHRVADKNLTDAVSNSLATQLVIDNPEGPQVNSEGIMAIDISDQKAFITKALQAGQQEFSKEDFIEAIDEKRITPGADTSKEAATRYIRDVAKTLQNNFKTVMSETTEDRVAMFTALSKERTTALEGLYQLTPPPDLAELHRDMLTIVGTQRNIFDALKNYNSDPMKALLAMEFETEVAENITATARQFTDYITRKEIAI